MMAAALMVVATGGCDGLPSNNSPPELSAASPIIQTVEVVEVVPTDDAYRATTFLGTLKPRRNIPLAFTQGGRVAQINVASGDAVAADQALANTDVAGLELQKAAIESAFESTQQQLDANPNAVSLRDKVNDLQLQLNDVNGQIERATIRAPFAGTVTRRAIEVGQVVSAGMPLLDLVEDDSFIIEAKVATKIANGLARGSVVRVLIEGQLFSAKIATVLPTAKGATRTRTVTLAFDDVQPAGVLNSGDTVELYYWTQTGKSGFWLPYSALRRQSTGLWSAMIVQGQEDDTIAIPRTLDVIELQDQLALVQGALSQGDRVVVNGLNRVVPGQRVSAKPIENTIAVPGPPAIKADADVPSENAP